MSARNGGCQKRPLCITPVICVLLIFVGMMLNKTLEMQETQSTNSKALLSVNKEALIKDTKMFKIADDLDDFISLTKFKVTHPIDGLKLYFYKAFLDSRYNETYIRVYGLERKELHSGNWTCRWKVLGKQGKYYLTGKVPARKYHIFPEWPRSTVFYAFNFDCHFPIKVPSPDVLTEIELFSTEGYRVTLPLEETLKLSPKRDLAVCVKPVSGSLNAIRLIEWIEIQRLTGIKHFIIYQGDIQGQAVSVLEYYRQLGVVTVVSFPYMLSVVRQVEPPAITGKEMFGVMQQIHLVALQDCLYRFMGVYKYLQYLDVDEFMLPADPQPWPDVVKDLVKLYPNAAGFLFSTAWHLEESEPLKDSSIPQYLYTQKYAKASTPRMVQPKSVIDTSRAVSVNYHSVMDVRYRRFGNQPVDWRRFGYVHHFRGKCTEKLDPVKCQEMLFTATVDNVVLRYKANLTSAVKKVIDHLQVT